MVVLVPVPAVAPPGVRVRVQLPVAGSTAQRRTARGLAAGRLGNGTHRGCRWGDRRGVDHSRLEKPEVQPPELVTVQV